VVALAAAMVALIAVPFVPVGFPVLIAALVGVVAGLLPVRPSTSAPEPTESAAEKPL
jgi:ammonia channel protein AmtB